MVLSNTFTYSNYGLIAKAKFDGKVQGVVVQATKFVFSSFTKGKDTTIAGSFTSL